MSDGEAPGLRMTPKTQSVLRALLREPTREVTGLQICELAGLQSGTIHPALARLEHAGWLESRWEEGTDPETEGRPRRRYYRLAGAAIQQARLALARATESEGSAAPIKPVPGWETR